MYSLPSDVSTTTSPGLMSDNAEIDVIYCMTMSSIDIAETVGSDASITPKKCIAPFRPFMSFAVTTLLLTFAAERPVSFTKDSCSVLVTYASAIDVIRSEYPAKQLKSRSESYVVARVDTPPFGSVIVRCIAENSVYIDKLSLILSKTN